MQSISSVQADQVGSLLRPPALLEARQADWPAVSDAALTSLKMKLSLRRARTSGDPSEQVLYQTANSTNRFMTSFPDSVEGFVQDGYTPNCLEEADWQRRPSSESAAG